MNRIIRASALAVSSLLLSLTASAAAPNELNQPKAVDARPMKGDEAPDGLPTQRTQGVNSAPRKNPLSHRDQEFLTSAYQAGLNGIEQGRLATARGLSEGIKAFGQLLIDDHTRANVVLSGIAAKYDVVLPRESESMAIEKLMSRAGMSFDYAFAEHLVIDESNAIVRFREQAKTGTAPDLRDFVVNTLPTLEQHLKIARSLSPERITRAH